MPMKLTGMENIMRQLNQKVSEMDGQVKKEATKAGAEVFRDKMSENAPRSTMGGNHLADNIVISETETGYAIGPSKEFYYGFFLEFGTSKMSARPFAAPTFENNRTVVEEAMSGVLKARLGL